MLTIYRRHLKSCGHRGEGRDYRRCQCPVWVDGLLGKVELRESLKTRNWQKAHETVQTWEARGSREAPPEHEPMTIQSAVDADLRDALAQGLRASTVGKYRAVLRGLTEFAAQRGLRYVTELDIAEVSAFRESWTDQPITALKRLEKLRSFFAFCQGRGWITENPARMLKNPRVPVKATLPFSRDDVANILAAASEYRGHSKSAPAARAFILLLRYSGLRIGDAATLSRERINPDGRLFLSTAKTGTPVWLPLPPLVLEALDAIAGTGPYYFWEGEATAKSCERDWERTLRRIFRRAGLQGGHAHRFRDTFAVELLLAGVPLERVSILLGHQDVRVTQRHYSPWVLARQEQLEADVRRTWNVDLVALAETKGTPEVHGKEQRPN